MNDTERMVVVGNRVPRSFFVSKGVGESDITIHAGSFHLALKAAGVERYNIMSYSSILPQIAREVAQPTEYVHGAVLESIIAAANSESGERATAGIIYGWLRNRETKERYGGLVCEYNGHDSVRTVSRSLNSSLRELYENGFEERFILGKPRLTTASFIPQKKNGTAIVVIGFTDYVVPVLER